MKKSKLQRKTVAMLIALGSLALLFGLLCILRTNQKVCEFFATTFSRAWIFVFGNVLGWIPISFYELFLIAAILGGITFVVFVIIFLAKRKWQRLLSATLIVAISVFSFLNVYTATASFSYGRDPLPSEVYAQYTGADMDLEKAVELAENLITAANEAYEATKHDLDGNIVYPYTFQELSDLIAEEYKRLESDYFSPYTPKAKRIINKTIMSEMHIVGVFFAPFGEANINGYENNLYLPHTMAHEMAHGKGVMREAEANLVAEYILLTSENPYLRYGALVKCMSAALNLVRKYPNFTPEYTRLINMRNPEISVEVANYSRFYAQFDHFDNFGSWLNDIYLKLNNQKDGVGSYDQAGESQGTGTYDDFGQENQTIRSFSGTQNLLIKLYKEGRL